MSHVTLIPTPAALALMPQYLAFTKACPSSETGAHSSLGRSEVGKRLGVTPNIFICCCHWGRFLLLICLLACSSNCMAKRKALMSSGRKEEVVH